MRSISRVVTFLAGCSGLFTTGAGAQVRQPSPPAPARADQATQDILIEVHRINQLEIELGRLAQQKGRSREVQELGRMLEQEHRSSDTEVLEVARSKGVDMAMAERAAPTDDESVQRLSALSGAEFDRELLTAVLEKHGEAIDKVSKAPLAIQDSAVDQVLKDQMPMLHRHYQHASQGLVNLGMQPGVSQTRVP